MDQREQLGSCVKLLLLWVAASDGKIAEAEAEFTAAQFPGPAAMVTTNELLAVIRNADLETIEKAIRAVAAESRELRLAFLDLAVTMSTADRSLAISENHILRFYADALHLGLGGLEKRFEAITGSALPEPGDPSSLEWWDQVRGDDDESQQADGLPRNQPAMRDLYARLGIEQSADDAAIATSLATNPEMRADSAILLDRQKRAIYDGVCTTLKVIGALRQRLKLDSANSWFAENYPDFLPRPRFAPTSGKPGAGGSAAAPRQEDQEARAPGRVKSKPPARSRRFIAVILSLIGMLLVISLVTFLSR